MDIIYKYGIELIHKNGNEYIATCPVCNADIKDGHDRCFIDLTPQKEHFYCRKCQIEGSLEAYFVYLSGKTPENATKNDWREAYKRTEKAFNDNLHSKKWCSSYMSEQEYIEKEQKADIKEEVKPADKWQAQAKTFLAQCRKQLENSKQGQAYIASRGVKLETALHFSIGWNSRAYKQSLTAWGIEPTAEKTEIFIPAGLVIPTLKDGDPHFVTIRRTDWTKDSNFAKYQLLKGSKGVYFFSDNGIDEYGDRKPLFVFESILDAVLCFQESEGLITTAAANGLAKPTLAEMERIKKAPLVVYCFDSLDETGRKQQEAWRKIARDFSFSCFALEGVPLGKDPSEYWQSGGNVLQWIEDMIESHLPSFFETEQEPAQPIAFLTSQTGEQHTNGTASERTGGEQAEISKRSQSEARELAELADVKKEERSGGEAAEISERTEREQRENSERTPNELRNVTQRSPSEARERTVYNAPVMPYNEIKANNLPSCFPLDFDAVVTATEATIGEWQSMVYGLSKPLNRYGLADYKSICRQYCNLDGCRQCRFYRNTMPLLCGLYKRLFNVNYLQVMKS